MRVTEESTNQVRRVMLGRILESISPARQATLGRILESTSQVQRAMLDGILESTSPAQREIGEVSAANEDCETRAPYDCIKYNVRHMEER